MSLERTANVTADTLTFLAYKTKVQIASSHLFPIDNYNSSRNIVSLLSENMSVP